MPAAASAHTQAPTRRVWRVIQRSAYNADGSLWFPKILSAEWLENQRQAMGPYKFAAQYLNQAIADEERRFQPEWIVRHPLVLQASEGRLYVTDMQTGRVAPVAVYTTLDPAISQAKQADFSGLVTVAVDDQNIWHVLSARRFRGSAQQIVDVVCDEIFTWHTGVLGIEVIAFQAALRDVLLDRMIAHDYRVQLVELKTGTGRGKRARIEGLVPLFSQGRVIINSAVPQDLDNELLLWSPLKETGHDDLIDALSHHLAIAKPARHDLLPHGGYEWHDLPPDLRERIMKARERAARPWSDLPLSASAYSTGWEGRMTLSTQDQHDWRIDMVRRERGSYTAY